MKKKADMKCRLPSQRCSRNPRDLHRFMAQGTGKKEGRRTFKRMRLMNCKVKAKVEIRVIAVFGLDMKLSASGVSRTFGAGGAVIRPRARKETVSTFFSSRAYSPN